MCYICEACHIRKVINKAKGTHVVDVEPVPDGLEDPVGEAKDHQVLDGLLAQIVVDPVDLLLAEDLADLAVEADGGIEVAPEQIGRAHV